jgi:D-cysteine desulfhydrase
LGGAVNPDEVLSLNRNQPTLFAAFGQLSERLPWQGLVARPTPIHRLERLSAKLGTEIWIKRDDRTSPVYGGNKPRKLEFLLADARAQARKTVVTIGGLGTHHGLATTLFGRAAGFEVVLILFDQPVTKDVRRNLLLFQTHGARLVYAGPLTGEAWKDRLEAETARPGAYYIPGGGSSPVGTLGYVDAAFEVMGQIQRGEAPRPEAIFVAAGSGGTLAGLSLGLALAGFSGRLIGVRVAPGAALSPEGLIRLQGQALDLLRVLDPGMPQPRLSAPPLILDQYGPGYGHPTEAGERARALLAETEGIDLDPTYTAKAMAGLIDHIERKRPAGPVLFWQTFNSVALAPPTAGPHDLPPEFHPFFEPPETWSDGS